VRFRKPWCDIVPAFERTAHFVHQHQGAIAPAAQLVELRETVLKRCPVYNLIRDSKARVNVTWNLKGEA
jgi:hypothetical protein